MPSIPHIVLLLLSLSAATVVAAAASSQEDSELLEYPIDMLKDDNGKNYILSHSGEKFMVYRDLETNKLFFQSATTGEPQWEDPRIIKPVAQPAVPAAAAIPKTAADRLHLASVAIIPTMLFIAGVAARIYYLHRYYPELLFPTKDRKDRRKTASGKFKAQKARGKMSQDGKGGRSANS